MATFTFELKGQRRLAQKLEDIPAAMVRPLRKAIEISTLEVLTSAIRNVVSGPATGTVYEKYKPRRTHQASAAGESPASDTGRLASEITFDIHGDGLGADIGTNLKHGAYLETGTRDIEARPWLFPAFEINRERITERIAVATGKPLARFTAKT